MLSRWLGRLVLRTVRAFVVVGALTTIGGIGLIWLTAHTAPNNLDAGAWVVVVGTAVALALAAAILVAISNIAHGVLGAGDVFFSAFPKPRRPNKPTP